ncbi:MAG TPA: ADOP family duplicated permease [Acidobacteriota bacterium]|nr:ADOP family duplicated permease [Acidobacteriota bacterium]
MRIRLKHERLARELAERKLSQNRWAQRMGLDSGHLSQLVNGRRPYPSASTRRKLLEGLDLDFDQLFELEGPRGREVRANLYPPSRSPFRQAGALTMTALLHDLRQSLRGLLRRPGFAALIILTLALGIGANTAIFSLLDAVLLEPLPYPGADRLVRLWSAYPERDVRHGTVSPHDLEDWRQMSDSFEAMTGYPSVPMSGMVLTGRGEPQELQAIFVNEQFFETFDLPARQGRWLQPEDYVEGKNYKIVISQDLWRQQFGSAADIVGRKVTLNGQPFEIVGVMPGQFDFPSPQVQIWAPQSLIPESGVPRQRFIRWLNVIGRLEQGATLEQARQEMNAVAANLAAQYPDANQQLTAVTIESLREVMVGDLRTSLLVLMAAVGMVLLIACANIANLVLARSERRRRETALRLALGAGSRDVLRRALTESVLLGLLGGAAGLLLALGGIRLLQGLAPSDVPGLASARLSLTVLGFTLAASLLTGLLVGLFPALRSARADLLEALQEGGRYDAGAGRRFYRRALVVAQVALVAVLSVGAGLLIASYRNLLDVNPGFDPRGVITMRISSHAYKYSDRDDMKLFYERVLEQVRALPQVQWAGIVRPLPLGPQTFNGENFAFELAGHPLEPEDRPRAALRFVSDDYFKAMAIPLLQGRDFRAREETPVVIVNRRFSQAIVPEGQSTVGTRIRLGEAEGEIIGVVENVSQLSLDETPEPVVYMSMSHNLRRGMTLVARTNGDPLDALSSIQRRIWEVNPEQPIQDVYSMSGLVDESLKRRRFAVLLLGLFAALSLLLAAVGIYGTLSYQVSRRRQEIGVRISLGAARRDVINLILREGLTWTVAGLLLGLAGALALTRWLSSMLFQIQILDPYVWTSAVLLLLLTALAACYLPAHRASRLDPIQTLKYE